MGVEILQQKVKGVINAFAGNVCSSENPQGYKGIVVFGGNQEERSRLVSLIIDSFPYFWKNIPYVWNEESRGGDQVLYVDATTLRV